MLKRIIILILLSSSIILAQGSGTPDSLRILVDANGYLAIVGAVQTLPTTSSVFSNTRLKTDVNGYLQVVLTSGYSSSIIFTNVNGANPVVWLEHDPTVYGTIGTASGNVGGFKFGSVYQPYRFTNGPGGEPNYIDDVWFFGPNVGTLSTAGVPRLDATKPNVALTFESRFYQSSVFASEVHIQGVTADGLTTFRPLSFFMASDASLITVRLGADTIYFNDKAGNALMQLDDVNNALDSNGVIFRFGINNVPAIQQKNSTGTFVDLLYLNSSNSATIAAPLNITAPRLSANFVVIQPTTANSNDTAVSISVPTFTGTYQSAKAIGSVTGVLQNLIENDAVASNAHARFLIQTDSNGGDPYIYFNNTVTNWSIGLDNSDSDNLVFSNASTLGANNVLTITTAGIVTFTGPIVSPIHQGSGTGTSVANVGANSCGTTTATIAGNQLSGVITVGATAGTQCRVTFTTAAPVARDCTVTDSTTTIATRATVVDTSNTDFFGAFVAGDKITYQCTVR